MVLLDFDYYESGSGIGNSLEYSPLLSDNTKFKRVKYIIYSNKKKKI